MKRALLYTIIILIVASFTITACKTPAPEPTPTPSPSPAPAPAPTSQEPIKIGLIYPLTGPMAMTGARMLEANTLAFEQAGYQVAGREIEVVEGDSGSQVAMAIDTARRMVENDKVAVILGPIMGNVKMAVAEYMSEVGIPHLNTSPAPWPIVTPAMPWSIAGAGAEQQISSTSGAYAAKRGLKTVTLMTEDLMHSHGFADAFKAAFEAEGGQVIQEQFTPYPSSDFAPYLTALKDADALAAWYEGSDAILFLNQVHDFGIRKKMPVTSIFHGSFMANFILHAIEPAAAEACLGEITVTPYSPFVDNPVNKEFVEFFQEKYGYLPDDTDTTPYDGGLIILKALEATGGDTTPEKLRDAILGLDFMATQGRVIFDKELQCRIRNVYVCEVAEVEGKYLWKDIYTYEDVPPAGFAPPPAPPEGH